VGERWFVIVERWLEQRKAAEQQRMNEVVVKRALESSFGFSRMDGLLTVLASLT
jgi:hypothetical protein